MQGCGSAGAGVTGVRCRSSARRTGCSRCGLETERSDCGVHISYVYTQPIDMVTHLKLVGSLQCVCDFSPASTEDTGTQDSDHLLLC